MKSKAVFLDKDGTLVLDIPYNTDPLRMELNPLVAEGLQLLQADGYKLVVISNQSGVARGYFEEHALVGVYDRLKELCEQNHIQLTGFYYCPHHPDGVKHEYAIDCSCRKPAPGLIIKAGSDLDIDLKESWMLGDILNDVEAGNRAGCRTILIDNGNETEWIYAEQRIPDHCAMDLREAAVYILNSA